MAKQKRNDAPEGFRKVQTSISGFWKPEGAGEFLQGVVGSMITVKSKKEGDDNRFFPLTLTSTDGGPVVNTEGKSIPMEAGQIVGVSGKMLFAFLGAREGQEVFLVYRGKGKAKPGQSAPKLFETYEREAE